MDLLNFKQIHINGELNANELYTGSYLWLIHADKIPPHIGFSVDGSYFSLKVKGMDYGVDVKSVLHVIQRKKIKTLFFHVETISASATNSVFSKYKYAIANELTCLAPIKELMHFKSAKRIHDLLDFLYQNGQIHSCKSLHISDEYNGLVEYSEQDIHNRLKGLHES